MMLNLPGKKLCGRLNAHADIRYSILCGENQMPGIHVAGALLYIHTVSRGSCFSTFIPARAPSIISDLPKHTDTEWHI